MNTRSVLLTIVIICCVLLLAPYLGINMLGAASPRVGSVPEPKAAMRRDAGGILTNGANRAAHNGEQLKEGEGLLK
jgi:hypothetical protein